MKTLVVTWIPESNFLAENKDRRSDHGAEVRRYPVYEEGLREVMDVHRHIQALQREVRGMCCHSWTMVDCTVQDAADFAQAMILTGASADQIPWPAGSEHHAAAMKVFDACAQAA